MLPSTGEKAKRLLIASKVESDMMKKLMAFSVGAAMVAFTALANAGVDLSRFCAAPGARLSHLSFEGDRAFPAQC